MNSVAAAMFASFLGSRVTDEDHLKLGNAVDVLGLPLPEFSRGYLDASDDFFSVPHVEVLKFHLSCVLTAQCSKIPLLQRSLDFGSPLFGENAAAFTRRLPLERDLAQPWWGRGRRRQAHKHL
ncbi:hypothetical protein MRB53_017565 [Persea americana]|uniref:Uncharacterized protein n=1 Tax=Persea americana TaxID=3435 RepID=A0ACC2M517_PERAE|nr:hypothetical protein MRB53_017565 [Persea americana]